MTRGRIAILIVLLLGMVARSRPVEARILKTTRPGEFRPFALTLGSDLEYESDEEQSVYDFPFLIEYGFTDALTLTVEPNYIYVQTKGDGSESGMGDLETSVTYEFVTERRNRPAVSVMGTIKWPTAKADLGTGEADYSLGAIASKEWVRSSMDLNLVYTFVGDPAGEIGRAHV